MQSSRGFALITSLLLLVVLAAMGAGAIFLSNMNLGVAENGRSHAIAFASAEGGLEAAIVALEQAYNQATPREFPESFTTADVPTHDRLVFEVVGYEPFDAQSARVSVRGLGPRDAEYVSEAVIVMVPGTVDPFFARGLVSEQNITVNGASGTFIDAGLHTNQGVSLAGWKFDAFKYCTVARDPTTGKCPAGGLALYEEGNEPLSVWEGGSQDCGNGNSPFCDKVKGKSTVKERYVVEDEVVINIDYLGRRFRAAGGITDEGGAVTSVGAITLDGAIQYGGAACTSSGYLCLTGDQTLAPEEIQGKIVVSDGDITIDCSGCSIQDAVLISTNGTVGLGGVSSASNVRVFSESDLTATGEWLGESTLASAGNITFTGAAKLFQGWAGTMVGMTVIAEGNILTNGGGGTEAVGVFMAGRDFEWNGGGNVYIFGSVLIKGIVNIDGGYTIDAGNELSNPDLETGDSVVSIASRR